METTELNLEDIDQLLAALTPDRIAALDLDRLRELLGRHRETAARLRNVEAAFAALRLEHSILRQDYVARIAGMVKAVAAVRRAPERSRGEALREALEYVRSLESANAHDLLEQYRLTSARFREAFPASFGKP